MFCNKRIDNNSLGWPTNKLALVPIWKFIDDEEISHEETKRLEKEFRKLGYIEEDEEISYEEVNLDK